MDIWIPESARDTQPARFQCRICNDRFTDFRPFEAHVLKCSKVNEDKLHDAAEWHQEFNAVPDPEWESYNQALRREGIDPEVQFNRGRKSNIRRAGES